MSLPWKLVDLDVGDDELAALRGRLAPDELARAARFLREVDRRRFIVARGTLRGVLGATLGIPPERVAFVYGPHGKPALAPPQAASGLRFNLSHAAGLGLIGWAHRREIGVDVELVRPVRFGTKIARRYFSDDEQTAFAGVSGAVWDETFFRCWTRKEAFIKAVGDGLAHPLRSFSVPMSLAVTDEPVLVHGDDAASKRWQVESIDAGPGFLGAIVTEREDSRASS